MSRLMVVTAIALFLSATAGSQATCIDLAEESYHSLIFRNSSVRIFELQLPRLKSTAEHCHKNAVLTVVTTESRTTDGMVSDDWTPGAARFVFGPFSHTTRNEDMMLHREIVVETLRTVPQTRFPQQIYGDPFGLDQGDVKPTWNFSFTRAGLTGTRIQLAPGDSFDVSEPDHLLIATSDVELRKEGPNPETLSLSRGDTRILEGGSARKLTNAASEKAKFVLVEF
jgi:hypothetical protein